MNLKAKKIGRTPHGETEITEQLNDIELKKIDKTRKGELQMTMATEGDNL